jgi:hypothetical protein
MMECDPRIARQIKGERDRHAGTQQELTFDMTA